MQVETDIFHSAHNLIRKKANFEELYQIRDENSIREMIDNLQNKDLSIVYNFIIDFMELNKDIQKKVEDRRYL